MVVHFDLIAGNMRDIVTIEGSALHRFPAFGKDELREIVHQ